MRVLGQYLAMNKHIADLCEYRLVKTGWNQNGFDQVSWFDYTLLKLTSIAKLDRNRFGFIQFSPIEAFTQIRDVLVHC